MLEATGDVADLAGLSREAIAAYRRARDFARSDPVSVASLMAKEVALHQRIGQLTTALRIVAHARGLVREESPRASRVRSQLTARLAFVSHLRARHADALRWSALAVLEAQRSGDSLAVALAFNVRDLILTGAGKVGDQPFGELALASYEKAGDLLMMSRCLINLAMRALQEGRWPLAQERLERAAELMRRVGDTAYEALVAYNLADLAIRQGRFELAEQLLMDAARYARVADDVELAGPGPARDGQGTGRAGPRGRRTRGLRRGPRGSAGRRPGARDRSTSTPGWPSAPPWRATWRERWRSRRRRSTPRPGSGTRPRSATCTASAGACCCSRSGTATPSRSSSSDWTHPTRGRAGASGPSTCSAAAWPARAPGARTRRTSRPRSRRCASWAWRSFLTAWATGWREDRSHGPLHVPEEQDDEDEVAGVVRACSTRSRCRSRCRVVLDDTLGRAGVRHLQQAGSRRATPWPCRTRRPCPCTGSCRTGAAEWPGSCGCRCSPGRRCRPVGMGTGEPLQARDELDLLGPRSAQGVGAAARRHGGVGRADALRQQDHTTHGGVGLGVAGLGPQAGGGDRRPGGELERVEHVERRALPRDRAGSSSGRPARRCCRRPRSR